MININTININNTDTINYNINNIDNNTNKNHHHLVPCLLPEVSDYRLRNRAVTSQQAQMSAL